MMKLAFTLSFFIAFVLTNAQDIIYKKDKTKIEAKVLEVGLVEIRYKVHTNLEGPDYVIKKSDIVMIAYKNGILDAFNTRQNSFYLNPDTLPSNFRRNLLGIDIGELAWNSITISYEHIFGKKGLLGVRIPFAVGLGDSDWGSYRNNRIGTGIDLLYYPAGHGRIKYLLAPYFEWSLFEDRNYMNSYPYGYNIIQRNHYAWGIKNGFIFHPANFFSLSFDFGFGVKKDYGFSSIIFEPHIVVNLIYSFRF